MLILQKKHPYEVGKPDEDYEIFMAIPEKVGHDRRGNDIFKTTPDGKILLDEKGNQIKDDDLPIVAELFKKWAKERGLAP